MDWLLGDLTHFLSVLGGAAIFVGILTAIVHVLQQRASKPQIQLNPSQPVAPSTIKESGIYLGIDKGNNTDKYRYDGAAHITTIGSTRTGKSRRLLIPNLAFETNRSMVVIDIKGELAAITGEWRGRHGKVVYLNPFGLYANDPRYMLKSTGYNPLLTLDPQSLSFVDDAMSLAEDLIPVESNTHQPHFPQAAQNLLAALIMFVRIGFNTKEGIFDPETAEGRVLAPTFGEVRRLLAALPTQAFAKLIKTMTFHPLDAIVAKAAQFEGGDKNDEIMSILSTARTQTAFLDSPAIRDDLSKHGVDFSSLKRETTTVFLILPPRLLKTHAKWLRLIIDSAMRSMQNDEGLDRPSVLFVLDEFAQLGRMAAVETAVTLAAGYGIKVWAVVQNINQLQTIYHENWETFIDGGVTTVFQCRDVATPKYMSSLSGSDIIENKSATSSHSGVSLTKAEQRRQYLIDNHFYSLHEGDMYVYEPTAKGRVIRHITAPDFLKLPDVESGAIQLRSAPLSSLKSTTRVSPYSSAQGQPLA